MSNFDEDVVRDFGDEWNEYDQQKINQAKLNLPGFSNYFSIFPEKFLNKNAVGFDAGCGSGRWARFIAPKVKHLNCIDPSDKAIKVTAKNLSDFNNCSFECSSINDCKIADNSQDFGYCLGVLHHIPNTKSALQNLVSKLKKGSPLLLYIYYKFDNKPFWFPFIWKTSDYLRKFISRLPYKIKLKITKLIAFFIYLPMARLSLIIEFLGFKVSNFPLSIYRKQSFYSMKTDALDRFGTKLEKRFTKDEIELLMMECGLEKIEFSNSEPFWVVLGFKK